ncbi:MAG TPA: NINE protein [Phycisphaerae bacterium]|nr:NINE protein [Phycisphaerae bacterium]HRW55122.1 NINE protein [Phycisphaerae bacterium]
MHVGVSPQKRLILSMVCFFLGYLGIHRLVVGKIGTGLLYLFTGGLFFVGWFIDLILLLAGGFRDKEGRYVVDWL